MSLRPSISVAERVKQTSSETTVNWTWPAGSNMSARCGYAKQLLLRGPAFVPAPTRGDRVTTPYRC